MRGQDSDADAAEIQRLLARGNSKTALEAARQLHKRVGTPATEALLVDAYLARARSMLKKGLEPEAQALLAMVLESYPAAGEKLQDTRTGLETEAASLDEMLRPLNTPTLSAERRSAIEHEIRTRLADPSALARSGVLAPEHPLRLGAFALERALQAVTSGPVEDGALELPEISSRSPLAPWKPLLRAVASYYRREDTACEENLGAIEPDSAPARLVPALRTMLAGRSPQELSSAGAALAARAGGSFEEARKALRALEDSFERGQKKIILQRIREAMSLVQHRCPEMVGPLRQHIAVRAMAEGMSVAAAASAMGGLVSRDAQFCRLLARAFEVDESMHVFACMTWEEFRLHALRESWFRADGPEVATLYLHMAELAANVTPEDISDARQHFESHIRSEFPGEAPMADLELPFLDAGWLYERACALDPHAEAFERWIEWAGQDSRGMRSETVAQAWHRALPNDPRPLLHLMRQAESRKAFKKALRYLEQAEAVDSVNPEVRRARFRLTALSAIRNLRQCKTLLAGKELLRLHGLPQSRENNRPACLAALRRAACLLDGDHAGATAAQAQLDNALGGVRAGALAATGIAQICGLTARLPEKAALAGAQPWAEAAARACHVGLELGFALLIPEEWQPDILRELSRSSTLDAPTLLELGAAALRQDLRELAYAVSAAGLAQGGAGETHFLLMRGRALPEWCEQRRDDCLAATIELARRDRDMKLAGEAVAARRETFLGCMREGLPFDPHRVKTVVDRERRARRWPAGRGSSFEEDFYERGFPAEPRPGSRPRHKKGIASNPAQQELF